MSAQSPDRKLAADTDTRSCCASTFKRVVGDPKVWAGAHSTSSSSGAPRNAVRIICSITLPTA